MTNLALSLNNNLLDETFVFLQVQVVDMSKSHPTEVLATNILQ